MSPLELQSSRLDDDRSVPQSSHSSVATETLSASHHTLKHQDAFAIFNLRGDIESRPGSEEGFYFDGTRFLSELRLTVWGIRPVLLGGQVKDGNDTLLITSTYVGAFDEAVVPYRSHELVITRRIFLRENCCYMEVELESFSVRSRAVEVCLQFAADYADIYEIRGQARNQHGKSHTPAMTKDCVELSYTGLDEEDRHTVVSVVPEPALLTERLMQFRLELGRRGSQLIQLTVAAHRARRSPVAALSSGAARERLQTKSVAKESGSCVAQSSNGRFTEWFDRSISDLEMLTTQLPTGPYPYAGIPWFNTPFGRDGLITGLECLWFRPELARGVLAYLAETQATSVIPEEDAEPGKILHETRRGEMAALKEMPFGRYYGSVDATPLFVTLAGAYYERTADADLIRKLWPAVQAALKWMIQYGDLDGDGFLEYRRHLPSGLLHQGWKDSDDAIFHADGSSALGPLAICEVQAYAYAAYRAGAVIADLVGADVEAGQFHMCAERLKQQFDEAFWCEELGTYGMALDGQKKLCRVVASNAGQCLFSGIADRERAGRVAETLFSSSSYSGWGIRTLPTSSVRYNPMAYHNGSIWPHDNGLIAYGLARYSLTDYVSRLFDDLFTAAAYFERFRLPELFCGFDREEGAGPVPYPVACSPQAWSSASFFLLVQACLGLQVDGIAKQVRLVRPVLPPTLPNILIRDLEVGSEQISFEVSGRGKDVTVRGCGSLKGCSILLL